MRPRAVDWALLALVSFETLSGLGSFLVGRPEGRAWFMLHGVVGLAIAVLLVWKFGRVWRRLAQPRLWDQHTAAGAAAAVTVLAALGTGFIWTTVQRPVYYPNGMILHTTAGLVLAFFVLAHFLARFRPLRRADVHDRRSALRLLAALAAGGALWVVQQTAAHALNAPGAERRFTGSRRTGPELGRPLPVTMWMFDNPPPLDLAAWRLHVDGAVAQPLSLSLGELAALPQSELDAVLDCTGGWYSEQRWTGVRAGALLAEAEPAAGAGWVSFISATGYRWALPLAEAREALLATAVAGEPLAHGNGAPLRLVAPGRRGFQWVKWVVRVEVRSSPDAGQWGAIFTSGLRRA